MEELASQRQRPGPGEGRETGAIRRRRAGGLQDFLSGSDEVLRGRRLEQGKSDSQPVEAGRQTSRQAARSKVGPPAPQADRRPQRRMVLPVQGSRGHASYLGGSTKVLRSHSRKSTGGRCERQSAACCPHI